MVSGTLDLYPEYTGTSYTAILHHAPISDPRAVYDQVKQEYASKFNVEVSPPLGFENTFAILVRGEEARRLNLKTISDAAPHAPRWRAGFGQDFMSRADGYPGFSKTYGLKFAEVREMDLSLTYIALSSRQVDLIAGNSTEGRIATLDLFQLADDRRYFPPYEAVYLVRQDSLTRVPALREVLSKLANAISTEEMRRLNYEIDGNKRDPKEVVREWLSGKRLLTQRPLRIWRSALNGLTQRTRRYAEAARSLIVNDGSPLRCYPVDRSSWAGLQRYPDPLPASLPPPVLSGGSIGSRGSLSGFIVVISF